MEEGGDFVREGGVELGGGVDEEVVWVHEVGEGRGDPEEVFGFLVFCGEGSGEVGGGDAGEGGEVVEEDQDGVYVVVLHAEFEDVGGEGSEAEEGVDVVMVLDLLLLGRPHEGAVDSLGVP